MGTFVKRYWFHAVASFLIAVVLGLIVYMLWWGTHRLDVMGRAPEFSLTNVNNNQQVTLDSLDGKIKVITFIYTNCPDACPLTMQSMMQVQNQLKQAGLFGNAVDLITVTMDPTRDTPAVLQQYMKAFHADNSGWMMLRGDDKQTASILKGFNLPTLEQSNGLIEHQNKVFLIDKNRNERTTYDLTQSDQVGKIVGDLETLAAEK